MLAAPQPFSFILFGASGHLAQIKIYPAFYTLALKKRLPADYVIVGYARSEMSEGEFRALVADSIKKDLGEVNEKILNDLLERTYYHQGQYDDVKDYEALTKKLQGWEKGWKNPVRLAYLSIPPTVFPAVTKLLGEGKVYEKGIEFRCIVEKPVGHDMKSFEEIKKELTDCFGEENSYLLDHYLGKEAVRNIYYLRYANPMLERLFKNTLIEHVEITASETMGLEGRAGYFEHTGTLRDMFQSHLLMIASLLTMRFEQDGDGFRKSRMNALEQLYLPPSADLSDIVLQGQYGKGMLKNTEVPGYQQEDNVESGSRTNTFVALKLLSRTSRWQGVPFYLRSGKRLNKKETRISIQFQEPHPVGKGSTPNRLDIILQGEGGMRMHMQTKMGGTEPEYRPLLMEDPLVCVGDCLPEHSQLVLEAIHGLQQWYLDFEEVRIAWKLMDPLQAYLDKPETPLHMYEAGSIGPKEVDDWAKKDGVTWLT